MSYTLVLEWMPGDLYMSAVTARCTAPTSSYSVVWLPPNKVYQITLYCGSTSLVSFLVGAFRGKAWSYMKINDIETPRLLLRGFTKEDALWAYSIWNNPEMGQYLPDEAKEEIDDEYLKMLESLGEDEDCCYLIPVFKNSLERVGTCSFIMSKDKKVYDIAYCVHKNFWRQGYATEIAQGMINYARNQGAEKVTIYVGQENAASNRVAQKCGGKIVSESTYKKKGTDMIMKDYKYEIAL